MKTTLASKQLSFWYGSMLSRRVAILICGKAGVGKSTVANIITDQLDGYSRLVDGFAVGVKEAATKCFGWDREKDDKGRKLLQSIGNTGREYTPDLWAKQAIERADRIPILDFVIIYDWRFPNEKKVFEDNFYQVVTIRVIAPEREMLKGTIFYNDISETSLDGYETDFVIDNSDSVDELENKVKNILVELLKKE